MRAPKTGLCPARPPWGSSKLGAALRLLEAKRPTVAGTGAQVFDGAGPDVAAR